MAARKRKDNKIRVATIQLAFFSYHQPPRMARSGVVIDIFMYIDIYISAYIPADANLCTTCMDQGGAVKQMMPITHEHEAAIFERPFRTS